MFHFYMVNTTQKPVDRDLAQQITGRFTRMQGVTELPYLPHWYRTQVDAGTDDKALRIVEMLNEHAKSPLHGRIKMANDPDRRGARINQSSVVNAVKSHILSGTNPISSERDFEKTQRVVLNYLAACEAVFVPTLDPDETVAWTSNGLWFFTLISRWVFSAVYASTQIFTTQALANLMRGALEELDEEYSDLANERWWLRRTGGAAAMNRGLAVRYSEAFLDALNRSRQAEIQL